MQPDRVCGVPADVGVWLEGRALRLEPSPGVNACQQAARLWASLAAQPTGRGVGVVLSPLDEGGLRGLETLHAAGGFSLGREDAGLMDGAFDLLLPLEELATALYRMVQESARSLAQDSPQDLSDLGSHFGLVLSRTGRDFSHYKHATLLRRLERRLTGLSLSDMGHTDSD